MSGQHLGRHTLQGHDHYHNWSLTPKCFTTICTRAGTPQLDLFASRHNHLLPAYLSLLITRKRDLRMGSKRMRTHRALSICSNLPKRFGLGIIRDICGGREPGSHDSSGTAQFRHPLFHSHHMLSPVAASNAMVAIRDPISFGFGVRIDDREQTSWGR